MTQIAVLNSQTHRDLRVEPKVSARYGDNQGFVPVVVNEFSLLAVHYPILLSKDAETGAFYCGAMLGFDLGENLFLDEGRGQDGYRPLNLRRAPFFTAGADLAIDLNHARVGARSGQRVFDDDGKPTPYLESIFAVMRDLQPGLEMSKAFVATLLSLKLVESVSIDVGFDDGTTRDLHGLYTIDQVALRALLDATVVDLFRRGYLQLIYLMIASLKQVPVLARRKNLRLLEPSGALVGQMA